MKIQPSEHAVVVDDPTGQYWEGAVVSLAQSAVVAGHGGTTLPVVADQFARSGCGGYAKRSWGGGLPLDARVPTMVAPLCLYVDPALRGLVWRARVVPDASRPVERPDGTVRFVADSGQRGCAKAAYSELLALAVVREWPAQDSRGGWTVGGEGRVTAAQEGVCGFALYACAPGLRVLWVAASLASLTG
jgi:hypothetical protein